MITPILQFGTSRFLQAHADLFISEAMQNGAALGPVCVVQTTRSAERGNRLPALEAETGFPVRIRGKLAGKSVDSTTMVTSVKRALSIHDDPDDVEAIFVRQAKIVICNTADKGYDISMETDKMPEGVPSSFPGKLLKLLHARWRATGETLTILPAELISHNGDVLKRIVLDLASAWRLDALFQAWVDSDVIFTNTLVDRIVSQPLEPAGAIAEPYALWAIERQEGQILPCIHPSIVIADDISSFERLKLYILNLGHTLLTEKWLRSDLRRDIFVRELLELPEYHDYLQEMYALEILPAFAAMGMRSDAESYIAQTIERFENPFLDHRMTDIAQNHAEKVRRRAGGLLEWSHAQSPALRYLVDMYQD